jgi:predicted hotdog family 3-hydroxylacyl-ACP dehydratase
MAQAAAALAGAFDRAADADAARRPGFLLGTRRLDLGIAQFLPGVKYRVSAVREYVDGDSAAFACEISEDGDCADGKKCAATLTAYRPPL